MIRLPFADRQEAGSLLADELADTRMRLSHALSDLGRLQGDQADAETRAARAVDAAARKVEALLAKAAG